MFSKKDTPQSLQSRQALLWLHPTSLVTFMTSSRWVITEGSLPEDIAYSHVYWDPARQLWGIVCMSKEFKELKLGEPLPELPPVKFRYYNPGKDGIIE